MSHLHVWLHGVPVGTITHRNSRLTFTYARDAPYSLSTALDRRVREHPHRTIHPWLAGLLPENELVLQRWAREQRVSPTAFALLGTPIGLDCAGAVQFTVDDELPGARASGVEWLDDTELGALGAQLSSQPGTWGPDRPHPGRFSLAGAQNKIALRLADDRYGIPYGDEPTNVIVKPSLPGHHGHVVNEHLCLTAARRLGLPAAESRLVRFGDHRMFVTRRYDRARHGDSYRRVHQEDLCQSLAVPPTDKYQSDGGPTPAAIAERLREVVDVRHAEADVARFADALLFNWLVVGTDAHGKNYSLLLPEGGGVRLAPLYDLASILPYEPDRLACTLAMKLGGEYRIKAIAAPHNLPRAASELGVDADRLTRRARAIGEGIADALADAAVEAGLGDDPVATRLVDRVASHADRSLSAV